jgi:hypothetical protein
MKSFEMRVLSGLPLIIAASVCLAGGSKSIPRFEDFPVGVQYAGPAHPVDLKSHADANRYRTVLREGATRPPDFAGKYKVVSWGCGSPCHTIALVDLETGRVYFGPETTLAHETRPDSSLLVLNPPAVLEAEFGRPLPPVEKRPWYAYTMYYAWSEEDKKFRLVYSENAKDTE